MIQVAQINYNVFQGLGQPDAALCDLNDIHYAVRTTLALLTGQARSSDNNQLLSVTNELSRLSDPPLASPYDLSDEMENTTPAWVEIKNGGSWRVLDIVSKTRIEERKRGGIRACCFYGIDRDGTVTPNIEFSFDPAHETIRIWFDQDKVYTTLDSAALIPDNLTIYAELLAQNRVIMLIKRRLSDQLESEENRKLVQIQLQTWSDLYAHNLTEIKAWKREFQIWKNRTRSAQSKRRRPRRSTKNFFGR